MITKKELLAGRDKLFPQEYTDEVSANLDILLEKMNVIRAAYAKPLIVNSGWRPSTMNAMVAGASKTSWHRSGHAVDFNDPKGELFFWCLDNLDLLDSLGLYLEDPRWTRTKTGGWLHIQNVAPKSRKRIFVPSSALPIAPNFWNGKYDSRWDR